MPNKYQREIKPGVLVDVYDVLKAFNVTDPALQHLIKKALAVGQRGHKDVAEDLQDILSSSKRAIELSTPTECEHAWRLTLWCSDIKQCIKCGAIHDPHY